MANVAVLERSTRSMKRRVNTDDEIGQILSRLEKLSQRPNDPGHAYRNLETIHALIDTLRGKLDNEKTTQQAKA